MEALLAELGVEHRIVTVEKGADGFNDAGLRALNPRCEVPTLVMPDHSIMTESAAMMIYLADMHADAGLAPAVNAPERTAFLRWMIYCATTIYMSDLRYFFPERYTTAKDAAGVREKADRQMAEEYAILAEALANSPFLAGERFSAVDIYAAMMISWAPDVASLLAKHPRLATYYRSITERPKIAKVWARNGL